VFLPEKLKTDITVKKKIYKPRDLKKFKEIKGFSVTVSLYAQTVIGGVTRSVFKISAEDNTSGHKVLGCCLEKTKNNVDIFLNYVLENIPDQAARTLAKEIFFDPDRDRSIIVGHKRTPKTGKLKKMGLNEILSSLYREMILGDNKAEIGGYLESSGTFAPPIFVDAFLKDIDKISGFADYFKNRLLNEDERKIFTGTIEEIGTETAAIEKKYDLEEAVFRYDRLISAAYSIEGLDGAAARFVLKKAKISFHLKDYSQSAELLETCRMTFEKYGSFGDLGESYYYTGMIDYYFNRIGEAKQSFSKASRLLVKCCDDERVFIRNMSRVMRYFISKNYSHALNAVNSAIRQAAAKADPEKTAELYGLKADIYYSIKNHKLSIEALDLQYEHAVLAGNIFIEARCLTQMFQLIPYTGVGSDGELKERLARVRKLSALCKKEDYYYCCLSSAGMYYYTKGKYSEADRHLSRALRIFRPGTEETARHVVNMIYLSKIRIASKNYLSASRVLFRMLRLCDEFKVTVYPAYIHNLLGRISYEQKKYSNSVLCFKRALKLIADEKINDPVLEINSLKLSGFSRLELNDYKKTMKDLSAAMIILNRPRLIKYSGYDEDFAEIKAAISKIPT
jgi:tetratricopeptide (TPR) repeat protein